MNALSDQDRSGKVHFNASVFLYSLLFVLYFAYRSFYWRDSIPEEWGQITINALADTGMILLLSWVRDRIQKRWNTRLVLILTWLVLSLAGSLLIVFVHYGVHLMAGTLQGQFRDTFMMPSFQVFDALVVVMIGFSISTAFGVYTRWTRAVLQIERLEKEKAITEINYLKSQINPHFVFNTLNAIHFLIHDNNETARKALQKFSEMLRYQLYDSNAQTVDLADEVRYIKSYVDLQKLRKEKDHSIVFETNDLPESFQIAPMLLIIPVENAFKHMSYYRKHNFVHIKMHYTNGRFSCEILNSKDEDGPSESENGIGLGNLKRRLELLYNSKAELKIEDNPDSFYIKLTLEA